jgi:hypothetical protein
MASDILVNEALILDFVEWVAAAPRTHRDVMDAWRTSCPRLTIWEDAVESGYVERGPAQSVHVTQRGLEFLKARGRLEKPAENRPVTG